MGAWEQKLARNEAVFREVNERVAETAARFARAGAASDFEFLCECADSQCADPVPMTLDAYEHIRSDSTWFFVRPGHAELNVEIVIERHAAYDVVEKLGEAAAVAITLDRP